MNANATITRVEFSETLRARLTLSPGRQKRAIETLIHRMDYLAKKVADGNTNAMTDEFNRRELVALAWAIDTLSEMIGGQAK